MGAAGNAAMSRPHRRVSVCFRAFPATRWVGAARGSLTLALENIAILWREQPKKFGISWVDPEIVPNQSTDTEGNWGYSQESWPQLARVRMTARLTF